MYGGCNAVAGEVGAALKALVAAALSESIGFSMDVISVEKTVSLTVIGPVPVEEVLCDMFGPVELPLLYAPPHAGLVSAELKTFV